MEYGTLSSGLKCALKNNARSSAQSARSSWYSAHESPQNCSSGSASPLGEMPNAQSFRHFCSGVSSSPPAPFRSEPRS